MFFRDYIRLRGIKENTGKQHILRIKFYCNFIGKSPSEIIEEAKNKIRRWIE